MVYGFSGWLRQKYSHVVDSGSLRWIYFLDPLRGVGSKGKQKQEKFTEGLHRALKRVALD